MNFRNKAVIWVLALCAMLWAATPLMAGTTGEIKGKVENKDSGEPMANVIIKVESPSLIAQNVGAVTNDKGMYFISALPPGEYTVTAEFVGYHVETRTSVRVYLDSTSTIDFKMTHATAIKIEDEVVEDAPAVETEETQTKEILSEDLLEHIPVRGRSYQSYLTLVPGVVDGETVGAGSQTIIHGARYRNTGYTVDGIDTTDPMTGTFGTNFNQDAIEQIEVLTAGFEAEYGNYQGGIANLITKSGGNEYEGSFSYYYQSSGLDGGNTEFYRHIPTFSLGGPVLKDKVWFFASVEYDRLLSRFPGMPVEWWDAGRYDRWTTQYLLKATWQVNPDHKLVIQYSADPYEADNIYQSRQIPPDSNVVWQQGGFATSARLTSVFTNNVFLETMFAGSQVNINLNDKHPWDWVIENWPPKFGTDGVYSGPWFRGGHNIMRSRYSVKQDLSIHTETFGPGSHDIKVGYNAWQVDVKDSEFIRDLGFPSGPGGTMRDNDDVNRWTDAGAGEYVDANNIGIYIQDRWIPVPGLTLNLGGRMDVSNLVEDNNISPRFGVAWDPFNEGKTVVRASWSRFYDTLYLAAYTWDKWQVLIFGYRWPDPDTLSTPDVKVLDDNIEVPYTDEWTVGVEQEILPELSLSVRYIRRIGQAQLQDIEYSNYYIPGGVDPWPEFFRVWWLTNGNESRYEAIETVIKKRLSRNWEILGSYTWSRSLGSGVDHGDPDTDDPRRIQTEFGFLPYDFRHFIKLSGVVYIGNFTVSGIANWRSGTPFSVEVFPPFASEGYYIGGRNSNRLGDLINLDLAVERDFRISDYVLSLRLEGFNIFNTDDVVTVFEDSTRIGRENGRRFGRRFQLGFKFNF